MSKLATRTYQTLLICIACETLGSANAFGGHGSSGDEEPEVKESSQAMLNADGSDASVVQVTSDRAPAAAEHAKDANSPKAGKEGNTSSPVLQSRSESFPLYILASGPTPRNSEEAIFPGAGQTLSDLISQKMPGARIIRLENTSLSQLGDAGKIAFSREPAESSPSSAILILNTDTVVLKGEDLRFLLKEGYASEQEVTDSIRQLANFIFPASKYPPEGRPKLDVILLTSFAGKVHCNRFPGPIFGMTSTGTRRDPKALSVWLEHEGKSPELLFPFSAKEWFSAWGITGKISKDYFYCSEPGENRKYLGNKNSEDKRFF